MLRELPGRSGAASSRLRTTDMWGERERRGHYYICPALWDDETKADEDNTSPHVIRNRSSEGSWTPILLLQKMVGGGANA